MQAVIDHKDLGRLVEFKRLWQMRCMLIASGETQSDGLDDIDRRAAELLREEAPNGGE